MLTADLFHREIDMYQRVLPIFSKFQQESGLTDSESFLSYPRFFGGRSDDEKEQYVIVLEDARPQSFTILPKNEPIPLEHVLLTLKELGKYHGISFAMKDHRPNLFEELKALNDTFVKYYLAGNLMPVLQSSYDAAIGALENEQHIKIMEEVKENTTERLHQGQNVRTIRGNRSRGTAGSITFSIDTRMR